MTKWPSYIPEKTGGGTAPTRDAKTTQEDRIIKTRYQRGQERKLARDTARMCDSMPFFRPKVTLTDEEMRRCEEVAKKRMEESQRRGHKNQYGAQRVESIDNLGCYGEYAIAKQRGVPWRGQVNDEKNPDVEEIEVKTASSDRYNLILRERDQGLPGKRIIVLVTQNEKDPHEFTIQGWITRAEAAIYAKQDTLDPKREPAWKVLKEHLRDYGNLF